MAPTPGDAKSKIAKINEATPLSARSHSPRISFRRRTAATISSAPVMGVHAAMT